MNGPVPDLDAIRARAETAQAAVEAAKGTGSTPGGIEFKAYCKRERALEALHDALPPTVVPALLAEIERLREALSEVAEPQAWKRSDKSNAEIARAALAHPDSPTVESAP